MQRNSKFAGLMILLPTAYCPPIIYMAQFVTGDGILIEKEETYPKQTWRNRCSIYTANGKLDLSIPVSKPQGKNTRTKDVLIFRKEKWNLEHWRAIQSAYSNSPFFLFYGDELEDLFMNLPDSLLEHNDQVLQRILKLLNINTDYKYTENFAKQAQYEVDLRFKLSPKQKLKLNIPEYPQVFAEKSGFIPNLSILDLLFNKGPETASYLKEVATLNYLG